MKAKALEVRDRGTFIPVLCVDMNPEADDPRTIDGVQLFEAQRYLLRRCGYPCDGEPTIIMCRLDGKGNGAHCDPYDWRDRTMAVAHSWIISGWDALNDGDVVDVEFILGETTAPKRSEREEWPL